MVIATNNLSLVHLNIDSNRPLMNNTFFKQSALIISVIVTALFVLSGWDPFHSWLGIAEPAFFYAKWLAVVWLLLAIFRNLKLKHWVRVALAIIPVVCIVWLFVDESLLCLSGIYFPYWSRCFIPAVFIPLIGIKPTCGKSLKTNLAIFAILMAGHLCLRFLTGYQVGKADLFIPFARPFAIIYDLICAGSIWALISLSGREAFSKTLERGWIEWACAGFCLIGMFYVCFYNGLSYAASTGYWFVVYPIYRLIKSIASANRKQQ